jgi:predicted dithiol-disulfide oxidoreductase (DUF899 family)
MKYEARQNRSPLKGLTSNVFEWLSTYGTDFNLDFDVTPDAAETLGLSVFRRDGHTVTRKYFANGRGVEMLGRNWISWTLLRSADRSRIGAFACWVAPDPAA